MKQKYRESSMPLRRKYEIERMAANLYKSTCDTLVNGEQEAWGEVVKNEGRLL